MASQEILESSRLVVSERQKSLPNLTSERLAGLVPINVAAFHLGCSRRHIQNHREEFGVITINGRLQLPQQVVEEKFQIAFPGKPLPDFDAHATSTPNLIDSRASLKTACVALGVCKNALISNVQWRDKLNVALGPSGWTVDQGKLLTELKNRGLPDPLTRPGLEQILQIWKGGLSIHVKNGNLVPTSIGLFRGSRLDPVNVVSFVCRWYPEKAMTVMRSLDAFGYFVNRDPERKLALSKIIATQRVLKEITHYSFKHAAKKLGYKHRYRMNNEISRKLKPAYIRQTPYFPKSSVDHEKRLRDNKFEGHPLSITGFAGFLGVKAHASVIHYCDTGKLKYTHTENGRKRLDINSAIELLNDKGRSSEVPKFLKRCEACLRGTEFLDFALSQYLDHMSVTKCSEQANAHMIGRLRRNIHSFEHQELDEIARQLDQPAQTQLDFRRQQFTRHFVQDARLLLKQRDASLEQLIVA